MGMHAARARACMGMHACTGMHGRARARARARAVPVPMRGRAWACMHARACTAVGGMSVHHPHPTPRSYPPKGAFTVDHKMVWMDWVMLLGWLPVLAGGATQRA